MVSPGLISSFPLITLDKDKNVIQYNEYVLKYKREFFGFKKINIKDALQTLINTKLDLNKSPNLIEFNIKSKHFIAITYKSNYDFYYITVFRVQDVVQEYFYFAKTTINNQSKLIVSMTKTIKSLRKRIFRLITRLTSQFFQMSIVVYLLFSISEKVVIVSTDGTKENLLIVALKNIEASTKLIRLEKALIDDQKRTLETISKKADSLLWEQKKAIDDLKILKNKLYEDRKTRLNDFSKSHKNVKGGYDSVNNKQNNR